MVVPVGVVNDAQGVVSPGWQSPPMAASPPPSRLADASPPPSSLLAASAPLSSPAPLTAPLLVAAPAPPPVSCVSPLEVPAPLLLLVFGLALDGPSL
jgi:hypothetical protein